MRPRLVFFSIGFMILIIGLCACTKKTKDKPEKKIARDEVSNGSSQAVSRPEPENVVIETEEGPSPSQTPIQRAESDYDAGAFGDVMLIRLFSDVTADLSDKNRALTYHLARAVLAGRDITFDQMHRDVLEVRQLFENILKNNVTSDPNLDAAMSFYLKQICINYSNYDSLTGKKFVPSFTFIEFEKAANAANATGAELGLVKGESLDTKLARLKKVIFDPDYQPILANPNITGGQDILNASWLNLYRGVSIRDLAGFTEAYPLNSRLTRLDDRLVEEIYRAGDKRQKIPPGLYSQELRRLIGRLHDALTCARRAQREILTGLIEFFRTGEPKAYEQANQRILSEQFDTEFHIGFVDTELDPRKVKAIYSGVVGNIDRPNTSRVNSLVRHIQHFEDGMPWEAEYKKKWGSLPEALAIQLVVSVQRDAQELEPGLRVFSSDRRADSSPQKILIFSNVIESYHQAIGTRIGREFVVPEIRPAVVESLEQVLFVRSAIRMIFGRDLGQTSVASLRKLRGVRAQIEELKAELSSLWLLSDPKLGELGLLTGRKAVSTAYQYYVAELIVSQMLIDDDPLRKSTSLARRILARYLVEKAKVVQFVEIEGKTYPQITDITEFKKTLAELLVKTQKILANGDRRAALRLVRKYSQPAEWPSLEEFIGRAKAAGLKKRHVYVMPKLKPHFNPSGKVIDISISYEETFEQQMMRYRPY
jgi:dipeptidyl-peptidase III